MNIEFTPVQEVATTLRTTPRKVVKMILNGTLPIGSVAEPEYGGKYTTRIYKSKWEKFLREVE